MAFNWWLVLNEVCCSRSFLSVHFEWIIPYGTMILIVLIADLNCPEVGSILHHGRCYLIAPYPEIGWFEASQMCRSVEVSIFVLSGLVVIRKEGSFLYCNLAQAVNYGKLPTVLR